MFKDGGMQQEDPQPGRITPVKTLEGTQLRRDTTQQTQLDELNQSRMLLG